MPAVVVPGSLHGPSRRSRFRGKVQIKLMADSVEQRDMWLEQIRALIAPWKLIHKQMKQLQSFIQLTGSIKQTRNGIEETVVGGGATDIIHDLAVPQSPSTEIQEVVTATSRPFFASHGTSKETLTEKLSSLPEELQKLDWVDKLTVQANAVIGVVTTGVKLGRQKVAENASAIAEEAAQATEKATQVTEEATKVAERATQVAETAQFVADISKCVAGASTVFQLVVLSAKMVSRFAEAKRGALILPETLDRAIFLLGHVLRSLAGILDPTRNVEVLHQEFAFKVLEKTVDTMCLIEAQILRGSGSKFLNAKVVKEIESTMEELERDVVLTSLLPKPEAQPQRISVEKHQCRPDLSRFFVGRTNELLELKSILHKYGSAAVTQYGGAGKTELLLALAKTVELEKEVPAGVFWVKVGGGKDRVVESLANLVDRLREKRIMGKDRKDPVLVVSLLKQCLSKKQGRWLLCLDNADDEEISPILESLCALADPAKENGWVVVTSRRGGPSLWSGMKKDQKLNLKPLSEEDAMVLLWRQFRVIDAKDADDESVMKTIDAMQENEMAEYCALRELCGCENAYGLGGLPLALVQAGTYIGRFEYSFDGPPFGGYLKLLKETNENGELYGIFREAKKLSAVRDAQKSILTTWKINVDRLSNKAYEVLLSMSMLGPGSIPESIVRGILERAADGKGTANRMMRDVLMEELVHGSSLVYRERSTAGDTFGIHQLIRRFVLADIERGSASWKKSYRNSLLSVLTRIEEVLDNDGHSFENLPEVFSEQHRQYLPHSLAIVNNYVLPNLPNGEEHNVAELYDIAYYSHYSLEFFGNVGEAESIWRIVLAALEFFQGTNRNHLHRRWRIDLGCFKCYHETKRNLTDIATAMNYLGMTLEGQGRLVEAEAIYDECLKMQREIHSHDANHPSIAILLGSIGGLYEDQGRLIEAEAMYDECLKMEREIHGHGAKHPSIAILLGNIGLLYRKQGRLEEAEAMYDECLKMEREIHGHDANHPSIAATLGNIGTLYWEQGRLVEAEAVHGECLKMEREILGRDANHPSIATTLGNIGGLYGTQGRLEEAEAMHDECLKMKREIYGHDANHPSIATTLGNIGDLYGKQGRLVEAEVMFDECLKMEREIHGSDANHPSIATTLGNIGGLYEKQGRLVEAEAVYGECLSMLQECHGHDANHPSIATTLSYIGGLYESQGRLVEAETMYDECLKMEREIHGHDANHPRIATTLGNIGTLYQEQGRLVEAEAAYGECLSMFQEIHGCDAIHPSIAAALCSIGCLYESQGRLVEAEALYDECLKMNCEIHGRDANHPSIAIILSNIGLLYEKQGRLVEAEAMYDECLRMLQKIHGHDANHPSIATTLGNIGSLYESQGRLVEAGSMYDDCLKMNREIHGRDANHPSIAATLGNIGGLYERQGRLVEAEAMYGECLNMLLEIHGRDAKHPSIATTLGNIGGLYESQGMFVEAETLYDECLKMEREIHGHDANHPSIATTLGNIGHLYKKLGRLVEAEAMYNGCLKMLREIHGRDANHPNIATTLDNIGGLYESQGRLVEAELMYNEYLKMAREIHGSDANHGK